MTDAVAPTKPGTLRYPAALVVLLLSSTLGVMAGAVVMPVLELIRSDFGVTGTAAGLIITTHGLVIALSSPLVGKLLDRRGVRGPLSAGLVLYGLGGGAGMVVTTYPALIASRLLLGLGAAVVFSGTTVALLGLYQGEQRDRVLGWRTVASTSGGFLWPLLAGLLGGVSWHAAFVIYLIGIPLGVAVLSTVPDTSSSDGSARADHGGVLRLLRSYPVLLGWLALMTTSGMIMYSVAVFLPQRLARIGVHDPFFVSLFMVVSAVASGVVGLTYARTRRWLGYTALLRIAVACWAAGFLALGTLAAYPLILGCALLLGTANGLLLPTITVLIGDTPPPEQSGRATSLSGTAMFLGQFLSPLVFGPLMEATTITGGYLVAAACCAVVLVLLSRARTTATR